MTLEPMVIGPIFSNLKSDLNERLLQLYMITINVPSWMPNNSGSKNLPLINKDFENNLNDIYKSITSQTRMSSVFNSEYY